MNRIFEAYIYRPNSPDDLSGVSVKLPATPYEILDSLEKAHHMDGTPYMEITSCKLDCLSEMLSPTTNLHELNHLAERLGAMSDWELDCYEGMVMMETAKTDNSPIPLERLINMTHSIENCQIAYEVHDDKSLGRFYVDNDFPVIPENLPEVLYELLDYETIGRKARIGEGAESLCGGVFIEKGYVVHSGELSQVYQTGSAIPQRKPLLECAMHTIEIEVCKGFFEEGNHTEAPLLPADDGMMERVLAQLEASDAEECSFRATDCIAPRLTAMVSDSLYASTNLHRYGEKLIAEKGVAMTRYGALWSYDGQTVDVLVK